MEEYPFTVRSEHFAEVMKGRKLIYLSPNASHAFENGEFDHDATFVVGGIVDKAIRRPVTYAKARRAGAFSFGNLLPISFPSILVQLYHNGLDLRIVCIWYFLCGLEFDWWRALVPTRLSVRVPSLERI